jgi:hypothetical protein
MNDEKNLVSQLHLTVCMEGRNLPSLEQLVVISDGVYEGDVVEGVRYPSPEHSGDSRPSGSCSRLSSDQASLLIFVVAQRHY